VRWRLAFALGELALGGIVLLVAGGVHPGAPGSSLDIAALGAWLAGAILVQLALVTRQRRPSTPASLAGPPGVGQPAPRWDPVGGVELLDPTELSCEPALVAAAQQALLAASRRGWYTRAPGQVPRVAVASIAAPERRALRELAVASCGGVLAAAPAPQRGQRQGAGAAPCTLLAEGGRLVCPEGVVRVPPGHAARAALQLQLLPWLVDVRLVVVASDAHRRGPSHPRALRVGSVRALGELLAPRGAEVGKVLVAVPEPAPADLGELRDVLQHRQNVVVLIEDAKHAELALAHVDGERWSSYRRAAGSYRDLGELATTLPPPPAHGRPWVRLAGGAPYVERARVSRRVGEVVAALCLAGGAMPTAELAEVLEWDAATVRTTLASATDLVGRTDKMAWLLEGVGSDLGLLQVVHSVREVEALLVAPPLAGYRQRWFQARRPVLAAAVVDALATSARVLEAQGRREEALRLLEHGVRVFGPAEVLAPLGTSEELEILEGALEDTLATSRTRR